MRVGRLGCAARFPGRTPMSMPPHGLPAPLAGWMMAGMCWCFMAVSARESGGVRVIPLRSLLTRAFCANGWIGSRGSLVTWLLVHGALRCGAAVCSWAQPACLDDLVQECACQAECCSGHAAPAGVPPPCETMSHVFVTCPVVSPAVGWLRELWRRIGGSLPPLDARVLVVGDRSVWEPEGGRYGWELWSHLRLLFCRSVWSLTSKKSSKALPARQLPRDMHSQRSACCRSASSLRATASDAVGLGAIWHPAT